jgi:EmrB/QacA subfamily drug resistance transporter
MNASLAAPCDSMPGSAQGSAKAKHPRLTLAATILASTLAFVDGSVLNVALPALAESFDASPAETQWTVNAYMLPLSALLLFGGAAGDRFGRRRLLLLGIILFTVASVGCALAPRLEVLLAGRALQGIGAALLMPNSLAILGATFAGEHRGRAIGTWAAVAAMAAAIGPPLGGWMIDAVGWRSIFLLNLPIALAAIILALRYVDESRGEDDVRLDWAGAALATAGLGAMTWGLTLWSSHRLFGPLSAVATAGGALLLSLFVLVEHRRGDRAMMPLGLFGSSNFIGLSLLTLFLYGALGGFFVLLPFVLIGSGYGAMEAGLALLPFPLIIALGSRFMGRLAERVGPKVPLTVGSLVTAIGYLLLIRVDAEVDYFATIFPAITIMSLGMAGAVAPLTTAVLGSVDARYTGTASGFNSAISRTGGMIATALVGAVIASEGAALLASFRFAAAIGAGLAVAAAASALLLLRASAGDDHLPPNEGS